MNKIQVTVFALTALTILITLSLTSCSSTKKVTIPLDSEISFEDTYTIIWNGYSKAFVWKDEKWQRAETFDYYFDVIQKRYDKKWKSVKSLHRIHPDYNGKAGQRDQTMYFEVRYNSIQDGIVNADLHSSLGNGSLTTDNEFRNSEMELKLKDANMFMPYNKIRITQHYDYENGKLTETVLLIKEKDGKEIPFMKNEEEAVFYIKGKLDNAPTTFE
jgi:hypothetical protein